MAIKDYYKVLGVDKNASADTIKAAFRKLAKAHHPDANQGDQAAEQRFMEISEAYEVLGNEENRKKYDDLVEQERSGHFHPPQGNGQTGMDIDWDDILSQMFGWTGGSFAAGHSPFGRGAFTYENLDVENTIRVPLREAFAGAEKTIRIGGKEQVKFRIPAGIQPGERIVLPGKGNVGKDGHRGDRLLRIELTGADNLVLDGLDLHMAQEIAPWEAALGATLEVTPLDKQLSVKVKPGARSGMKLRVAGQGYRDRSGNRGDLFIELTIQNPRTLPAEVTAFYKTMQSRR